MRIRFKNLIKRNSEKVLTKVTDPGSWDKGKWIEGTENIYQVPVLITNTKPEELKKYDGGVYTQNTLKMRAAEGTQGEKMQGDPLEPTGDFISISFENEQDIIISNDNYFILDTKNRKYHADFNTYILKKRVDDIND